jgi:thiol-disulfide isomerase/thioredoxin
MASKKIIFSNFAYCVFKVLSFILRKCADSTTIRFAQRFFTNELKPFYQRLPFRTIGFQALTLSFIPQNCVTQAAFSQEIALLQMSTPNHSTMDLAESQFKKNPEKLPYAINFCKKNADLLNIEFFDVLGVGMTVRTWLENHKKPVLLVFWATWCGPCLKEMPSLAKMSLDLKGDLGVLPISLDAIRNPNSLKLKKSLRSFSMPIYHSDHLNKIMAKRGMNGVPAFILLSPEGQTLWDGSGAKDWALKSTQKWILGLLPKKVTQPLQKGSDSTSTESAIGKRGANWVLAGSKTITNGTHGAIEKASQNFCPPKATSL